MIARIWHGWTTKANAHAYETLLREGILIGIQNRQLKGLKGIQVLRREHPEEIEFVTIIRFDSLDAVRRFAGENYEDCVVPPEARAVLSRFDLKSQHYEVREELLAFAD